MCQNNVQLLQLLNDAERKRRRRKRGVWARHWLLERPLYGQYEKLMGKLADDDIAGFRNFIRFEPIHFHEIVNRIWHRLEKRATNARRPLDPPLKIFIALRHYASGDSYHSLVYGFRVAHTAISIIVKDVSQAIVDEFCTEAIACPTPPDEWKAITDKFAKKWQFIHVLCALDGKRIFIRKPPNGGSLYYNYKGYHSIILMALVDAEYDLGIPGSFSDAQIYNNSELKEGIDNGTLDISPAEPLPGNDDSRSIPYFLTGDDVFALRTSMMKPYCTKPIPREERIFNYRLSRGRRVVENAFGILANRFQCLLFEQLQDPNTVALIAEACSILHNLCRTWYPKLTEHEFDTEDDETVIPGAWRNGLHMDNANPPVRGNRDTKEAKTQQNYLKHYYNYDIGKVSWQDNMMEMNRDW